MFLLIFTMIQNVAPLEIELEDNEEDDSVSEDTYYSNNIPFKTRLRNAGNLLAHS